MKLPKKPSNKKKAVIIGAIVLLVAVATATAFALKWGPFAEQLSNSDAANLEEAEQERKQGIEAKRQAHENDKGQTQENSPTTSSALSAYFTSASQMGDIVQFRTVINDVPESGECVLILSKDGQTITKNAPVQTNAHAATCMGFDVATSELSPGTWNATLRITSGEKSGQINTTVHVQ